MLINPGDLIPVRSEAIHIPWTKRKSQILNFLHRGSVTFKTYVYDTNVGDISPLSTYFNPERWSDSDLNTKFGNKPGGGPKAFEAAVAAGAANSSSSAAAAAPSTSNSNSEENSNHSILPRLLLYPEHDDEEEEEEVKEQPKEAKVDDDKNLDLLKQSTIEWIISQQDNDEKWSVLPTNTVVPMSKHQQEGEDKDDDVFASSSFWNNDADRWNNKHLLPTLQRPSSLWRFGSTSKPEVSSCSSSSIGNGKPEVLSPFFSSCWSTNEDDVVETLQSRMMKGEAAWPIGTASGAGGGGGGRIRLGSSSTTGWSSGENSVAGSTESLLFKVPIQEDLFSNDFFGRNETLV